MDQPSSVLLQVDNLKKYFPIKRGFFRRVVGQVRSVDGISFQISKGETLGLVGESGCGKTTTGRVILRAIEPTEGKVFFRRENELVELTAVPQGKMKPYRREMQVIFQD